MTLVIKEIQVKTTVEKVTRQESLLPENLIERIKEGVMREIRKKESQQGYKTRHER